jgi:chemotaxis protein methyltransferase CheR
MRADSQQIDQLLEILLERTGTDLTGYRRPTLERRISERLAKLGKDVEEYILVCRDDPDACEELVSAVTINVSSFFRNPGTFEAIARFVLPNLVKTNSEIRVWSAGCAAGEEAYSIAILIQEEIKKSKRTDVNALIFATDIDKNILKQGEKAIYPRESLVDTKLGIVDSYFSQQPDGFQLSSEIRGMVHFSTDDLMAKQRAAPAASIFGSFDIVLCRNVMIYFPDKQQKQALERLYKSMAAGGYLVLGDSETICSDLKSLFKTVDAKYGIYRK